MDTLTPREKSFQWAAERRASRGLPPMLTDAEYAEIRRQRYATGPEAEADARLVAERIGVHWTEVQVMK
ncbi:hypothetical protein [Nocardioides soli]|uniref:Uncharacterized protein n=1 Tax=Nocardioides soli TaxID=1036020 RepID=A0A7W4VZY0_9ACTN|nr:hypothetical protein [Nocardioides soli]MBB3044902.1 hypothetical protein [Nocardioides soli]